MSSVRVITDSNGRQFSSDSFDRFGDDLTELILSFLTFDDKIRLQCASKQWSSLIFNKQFVFKYCYSRKHTGKHHVHIREAIEKRKRFHNFLKKLFQKSCIRRIDFGHIWLDQRLLEIIAKGCPQLNSIAANFYGLRDESIVYFGKKFGHRIKTIHFKNYDCDKEAIISSLCPNLEELTFDDLSRYNYLNAKPLLKLTKLSFKSCEFNIEPVLERINQFAPNLKSIEIALSWSDNDINVIDLYNYSHTSMVNVVVLTITNIYLTNYFFINLSRLMPNVEVFKVKSPEIITADDIQAISLMNKITELNFITDERSITSNDSLKDKILINLFNELPKLTKIKTNSAVKMSNKLWNKMIEIANKRQNDKFILKCKRFKYDYSLDSKLMPKNLQIKFKF